jgi:P-type E1-E2 ATPase
MQINIPGRGTYDLTHLVLDVNGTIAANGQLIDGVKERLLSVHQMGLKVDWITADTRGRQASLDLELGWPAIRISAEDPRGEAEQKARFVRDLGSENVVAIGNGSNDAAMLREAALGIAVLGTEGLAIDALLAADVAVPSIHAALDLLREPAGLIATWRK